mmetsp:Transcript_12198/g.18388  ORF Transcript_12198/g.18388 Transcript_12198/m.18388 type:complete len:84 (+) Transcript_12198:168-419(+)
MSTHKIFKLTIEIEFAGHDERVSCITDAFLSGHKQTNQASNTVNCAAIDYTDTTLNFTQVNSSQPITYRDARDQNGKGLEQQQ